MFREFAEPAEQPLPPCAVCGEPGANGFWHTHLCDRHIAQWHAEAPAMEALELAHADAHPEDVETRGEYQFRDAARPDNRWVILKGAKSPDGISVRLARAAALAWVAGERSKIKPAGARP